MARAEGVLIAREMLLEARGMVQGVQVSAPLGKFAAAVDVIEALGVRTVE
jgi:homocysteine S-methyltransferase